MDILPRFSCADELTYLTVASHAERDIPITLLCQWNRLDVVVSVEKISRMYKSKNRRRWFFIYCEDSKGAELILKVDVKSRHCREQKITQIRHTP